MLNDPRYAGAGVLIAGDNYGCGARREHAAWALEDFGVRCVIVVQLRGHLLRQLRAQNGLLPVCAAEATRSAL